MIDGVDIPSIQCKMSPKWPKSMRKADELSLIFFDFYVPVLTPCLYSTETLLQLSENIPVFAVRTLWHPCLYTFWHRYSPSAEAGFSLRTKRTNQLD
jgi:hypothetical protein